VLHRSDKTVSYLSPGMVQYNPTKLQMNALNF
jgi:hypothetical protein